MKEAARSCLHKMWRIFRPNARAYTHNWELVAPCIIRQNTSLPSGASIRLLLIRVDPPGVFVRIANFENGTLRSMQT
jgi:hypothetical protein